MSGDVQFSSQSGEWSAAHVSFHPDVEDFQVDYFRLTREGQEGGEMASASFTLPPSSEGSIFLAVSGSGAISVAPSPSLAHTLSLSSLSASNDSLFPIEKGAAFYLSRDASVTLHTNATNSNIHVYRASRGKCQPVI